MLKIITIIGARPQIIKAAAISRAIRNHFPDRIQEIIVHTGQHYDNSMSQVFIDELGTPQPDYNLNIGSASHGKQTAGMITGVEEILVKEAPDYLVVYGDTNSTLAAAIAASKMHIPIVHIEAGLRSFNKSMPEEINRIVCDHVSSLLFSPTLTGFNNLISEGFSYKNKSPFTADNPGIFHCGDVMYDNSLFFKKIATDKSNVLDEYDLENKAFILSTIHRNNNTDQPERLTAIFKALNKISTDNQIHVVLPLHPRTSKLLDKNLDSNLLEEVRSNPLIQLIPPVSFLDMIQLESHCQMVVTDSGGVQKEAYFFKKPCIILRPETEWTEIVDAGSGVIADADEKKITESYRQLMAKSGELNYPPIFGNGTAAEFICGVMLENE
ncbi:MAG: UDP-N-acetylglucosamine 2-epimerase (non-hydrolyzing) [Bacteroidetes bacterium]|nr:MAG: UDP-N-acetylglucosamine 2-epimerase (non-hydrolyzing) [Bacteroidota bacterium]